MNLQSTIGFVLQVSGASQAGADIDGVDRRLGRLEDTAGGAASGADRLADTLGRIGTAASLTAVIGVSAAAGKALFEASASAERLRVQLNFASGGEASREMAYVSELANKLGLDLNSTAKAYASFAAASRGTAIEGVVARDVFTAVSKAAAVMGLSTEEASGALLALQQMVSKGKVSAEELTGQLGERLPGAAQIAARAMGLTTSELFKLMESGQLMADDFLPKFARQLEQELGGAAEEAANRLDASATRMGTAWGKFKTTVGDSGVSRAIASGMNALASDLNATSEAMQRAQQRGAGFWGQLNSGLGMLIGRAIGLQHLNRDFMTLEGAVADATATIRKFDEQEARNGRLSISALSARAEAVRDLARANAQLAASGQGTGAAGGGRGFVNPPTVAQMGERDRVLQDRRDALLADAAGVPDAYAKKMREAIELNQAGVLTGKAYTDFLKTQQEALLKATGAAKEFSDAQRAAQQEATKQAQLAAESAGLAGGFAEDWARLTKVFTDRRGVVDVEALTAAQARLLAQQPAVREATKQKADADKDAAQHARELARLEEKQFEDRAKNLATLEQQLRAQQQRNELIGLEGEALAEAKYRQDLATIALLEEQAALQELATGGAYDARLAYLNEEIRLKKAIAEAERSGGIKQAAADGARTMAEEYKRSAEQIGQSLADAIFQGGKSAGQLLKDYFRTLVLQPAFKAIFTGGSGVAGMSSALAGTGGGGGAAGGFDLVSTLANAATVLKTGVTNLGTLLSTGPGGLMSHVGTYISQFGGSVGSSTIAQFGTGMAQGSMTASGAGGAMGAGSMANAAGAYVMAAMIGRAVGQAISGGYSAFGGSGNTAVNAGAVIGSVLGGPIGGAIGAAIGGVVNRAFGRKLTDSGIEGNFSGDGFEGNQFEFLKGGWFRSDKTRRTEIDPEIDAYFDQTITSLRAQTRAYAEALGLPAMSVDQYTKAIRLSTRGLSEAQVQEKIAELFVGIGNELASGVLATGQSFARLGETASQTLERLGSSLSAVNDGFSKLGQALLPQSLAGADIASRLADVFGGLDSMASGMGRYFDAIYSDAEKFDSAQRQLQRAFDALGEAVPQTSAGYRALVEAQDLATASGRDLYASLVQLAPAWAEVQAAAQRQQAAAQEQQAALVEQVADARDKLIDSYRDEATRLRDAVTAWRDFGRGVSDFRRSLLTGSLSPLTPAQQYEQARRDFAQTNALAQAGDATAQGQLQAMAEALLQQSRNFNGSSAQYMADFESVREALADTAVRAQATADVQQLQLNAVNAQLSVLGSIDASATTVAKAMTDLRAAVSAALAGGASAGQLGPLPSFAAGANYLPRDMVAQLHAGERIIPAADNRALLDALRDPARNNDALLTELRALRQSNEALRAEVERMRAENTAGHAANVAATESSAATVAGGITRAARETALAERSKPR